MSPVNPIHTCVRTVPSTGNGEGLRVPANFFAMRCLLTLIVSHRKTIQKGAVKTVNTSRGSSCRLYCTAWLREAEPTLQELQFLTNRYDPVGMDVPSSHAILTHDVSSLGTALGSDNEPRRDKGPAPKELMLGARSKNNKVSVVIPDFKGKTNSLFKKEKKHGLTF